MRYLTLIFLLIGLNLFAKDVSKIIVKGNINVESGAILNSMALKEKSAYSDAAAAKSIQNIFNNGAFENITIDKRYNKDSLLTVVVTVVEFPIVEEFSKKKIKKLSEEKKTELLEDIKTGMYWSDIFEHNLKLNLKKEYDKLGYKNAKIIITKETLPQNRINIEITVEHGKSVLIKQINIYGNNSIKSKRIKKIMKTKKSGWFSSGKYIQTQVDEDLKRIIELYNEKGYAEAIITNHEIIATSKRNLQLNIYLKEGILFYFGDLTIEGNKRFSTAKLLEQFTFKKGQKYDKNSFEESISSIYNLYHEDGYIYSSIDENLKKEDNVINIHLVIKENTRAKIRKVIVKGNRKTKEKVIRRKLSIYPGEYYKKSLVINSQQRLYNTGFFEPNIRLTTREINNNGDLDIFFHLTDRNSGSLNGGIGYNSLDGFIGNLGISFNNLFGNSWRTGLSFDIGANLFEYSVDFTNPYLFDTSTLFGFSLYNQTRKYSDYNVKKFGGSLSLGRELYFLKYLNVRSTYSIYNTKYTITDEQGASDKVKDEAKKGWERTNSIAFSLSRSNIDNVFFPTTGTLLNITSEYAGKPIGGDVDFFKQTFKTSWFVKLFLKFALRTKWKWGYVVSHSDTDEVPPEEKFYVGGTGANGLRGYGNLSIPEDDEGGDRVIIFSNEIALPLGSDQVIGLLFFDGGNAYDNFEKFNFGDFKTGTGFGIRFRTPMGLIGLDFGYNLSNSSWQPHFQIGSSF